MNTKIINLGNSLSYINTFKNNTSIKNLVKFKLSFNNQSEIFMSTFLPSNFNNVSKNSIELEILITGETDDLIQE